MLPVHLLIHLIVQSATAKASGCTVRRLTCEHCHARYIYQLRRTVSASAPSYFFMGRHSKKLSAEVAAQAKLQKSLASEVDSVPCPACGKFQNDMLSIVRRKRGRALAIIAGILALIVALLWILTDPWAVGPALIPTAKIATGIAVTWILLSTAWLFLHDPNASAHRRTRDALGARCRALPAEEFDALLAEERAS